MLSAGTDMAVQINTFHWHVVDSQSFPLVIPGYTDIAEKAAYSADAVYTPQDIAHIVSYAGQVRPHRPHRPPPFKPNDPNRHFRSGESMFSSCVFFQERREASY
jgi:hypothetical protein